MGFNLGAYQYTKTGIWEMLAKELWKRSIAINRRNDLFKISFFF